MKGQHLEDLSQNWKQHPEDLMKLNQIAKTTGSSGRSKIGRGPGPIAAQMFFEHEP